jgi:RNA 3'-terminal phosphate cyclase (ATP)
MTDALHIDGSQGEGGGQIVRSSLALALVTGRSVAIDNIRAGREKPGLMRQHLTAVTAAAEICGGRLTGAAIGSRSVALEPGPVRPGNYRFSVGTAGSATLVLQTVLPALLIADGPSTLTLEGGTHNPWAPPYDFLERVYLPRVAWMGPRIVTRLERPGFYPAGGGRFVVNVQPVASLRGYDLLERWQTVAVRARVLLSNLPRHIAERELETVVDKLGGCRRDQCRIDELPAAGPGNIVSIEIESENVTELFTGFGRVGARAEKVASEAVAQAREYLAADVPVGPYLADQLLLPLGISAWQAQQSGGTGGGAFRTLPLTRHSQTHIEILRAILAVRIDVERSADGGSCLVRVLPPG